MSNGPAVVVRRQGFPVTSANSPSISTQGAYNGGGAQNSYLLTSTMSNKFNSKPGNGYNRPSTSSYQPSMYRSSRNMQNASSQLKNTVVLIYSIYIYYIFTYSLTHLCFRIII